MTLLKPALSFSATFMYGDHGKTITDPFSCMGGAPADFWLFEGAKEGRECSAS